MEYIVSKVYYMSILNELRKGNKGANHRSVVDYFNKTAGVKGTITKVKYV